MQKMLRPKREKQPEKIQERVVDVVGKKIDATLPAEHLNEESKEAAYD